MPRQEKRAVIQLTFSQLTDRLKEPLPLEYHYGTYGKPYLKKYPFYFNISHSGNYVLCVLSEQEVGVDIQLKAPQDDARVLQRFFSSGEREYWKQCSTEAEKRNFFYRMWCLITRLRFVSGRELFKQTETSEKS